MSRFDGSEWAARTYGYEKHMIEDERGSEIALTHGGDIARLIAAAPDLLGAAQYLREELNHSYEPSCAAVSKLSAAIAKALGQ